MRLKGLDHVTDNAIIVSSASCVSDLPGVLRRGQEHFNEYVKASADAFSDNTRRAVASDTAAFATFCSQRGVNPVPASPSVLVAYIEHAVALGHKPATISRRISSISHLHRAHGWRGEHDPTKAEIVRLRLRGVRRQLGTRQRQAMGITEVEIGQILAAHPKPGIRAVRDIAALLLARTGLLRRSELVAADWENLEAALDGTGRLLIKRSKADQKAAGAIVHVSRRAMTWLARWRTGAGLGADATGPILRTFRSRKGLLGNRLHPDDVTRLFRTLARTAGIDPARITSHSCRVGGAQDLVAAGFDLAGVMQCGRWRSPQMLARYTEALAADRSVMARYEAGR
jgi:site-specific recombinase XerD